jgi:hypothetical protein
MGETVKVGMEPCWTYELSSWWIFDCGVGCSEGCIYDGLECIGYNTG